MRHRQIVFALLVWTAILSRAEAQTTTAPTHPDESPSDLADRLAGWRQDLRTLTETLATKHKDAFTITPRDRFDAAVNDIDARLPQLTDGQVYFELKRLVAMVGDAHTNLGDGRGRFPTHMYPFSVLILDDGTYITATTSEHRSLLGKKIVGIGQARIDDVIGRLGAIVPHENPSWLKNQVKSLIMTPEALAFVGLAEKDLRATFTLADSAGNQTTATLEPMQPSDRQSPAPELAQDKIAATLVQRPANAIYGSRMLPESRDLYIWYDACRNAADKTVAQFADETLARVDGEKPQRVIVDLRRNSGGNSALIQPLIRGIAKRSEFSKPGRLFVLIGRNTFSSGLWAAEDLKRQTQAILVGEPTGGKPNSFGEQRSVELPYSGLTLYYSTKKWVRQPDADPPSLEPDVHAAASWADLVAGQDVAIDAVRAYNAD